MNGQSTASGNKTGKAIELQSTTVSAYTQVTVLTPDETTINDDTKKVDSSKPVIASPVATKTTHATPVATTKASSTTTTSTTTTTSSSSSSSSSGGKTITPTPIPTPTPSVVTASYEAESSQNTLGSNLQLFSCSLCSGGERVGWIYGSGAANALQFNDIVAGTAGNYTLQIYYYNSIANRVTDLYVSVDGGSNVEVTDLQVATVNCCDYAPYIATLTISLPKSTTNTITLSNPNGPAPDIDRIVTKS